MLLVVVLGACSPGSGGEDTPGSGPGPVDEVAAVDGPPCPPRLPQAEDGTSGFGTTEPAASTPDLAGADRAWTCSYRAVEGHRSSVGAVYRWERQGAPTTVPEARLVRVDRALAALRPVKATRACTADLGPRHLLVLAHEGDLTAVAVDDFGCDDVRLSDDPSTTAPGEGRGEGEGEHGRAVPGVLAGGGELLDALGLG
ncbi:hypothetical protein [Nocardioides sp. Arc9.136]|uniref:hypothetical protein n=1 Tax=Nocardioides sp. Arc9.136 TaxID=2996826 RepID=UPI002665F277|nr:hypothetical protein [Nocardioides sp. Arc9.136]WKN47844.1 hypothetical protein OSR43_17610 [Nocardioides sp. Arc9.136]